MDIHVRRRLSEHGYTIIARSRATLGRHPTDMNVHPPEVYSALHHTFIMVEQRLSQHRGSRGFDGADFCVVRGLADFE